MIFKVKRTVICHMFSKDIDAGYRNIENLDLEKKGERWKIKLLFRISIQR